VVEEPVPQIHLVGSVVGVSFQRWVGCWCRILLPKKPFQS
jgi:hypothetical protein